MSNRLGKGFEALFSADPAPMAQSGEPLTVPLNRIQTNPNQPRKDFQTEALEELASSIREKGIIQPILVERSEEGGFVIIAGERRFRAARMAGLEEIPVFVKNYTEQEKLEIALIENIQRTDLTPMEEARAYARLMESGDYTQEELAGRVGKQRSTIANSLRLMKLPEPIQVLVEKGQITPGHARAILSLEKAADQNSLAEEILVNSLSVRGAERRAEEMRLGKALVQKETEKPQPKKTPEDSAQENYAEWKDLANQLMEKLGTKVRLRGTQDGGTVEIQFYSLDDLNRLSDLLLSRFP